MLIINNWEIYETMRKNTCFSIVHGYVAISQRHLVFKKYSLIIKNSDFHSCYPSFSKSTVEQQKLYFHNVSKLNNDDFLSIKFTDWFILLIKGFLFCNYLNDYVIVIELLHLEITLFCIHELLVPWCYILSNQSQFFL